jgi:hypothetical protein
MKASEHYKMRFVELLGHPITDEEITTYGRLIELETIIECMGHWSRDIPEETELELLKIKLNL